MHAPRYRPIALTVSFIATLVAGLLIFWQHDARPAYAITYSVLFDNSHAEQAGSTPAGHPDRSLTSRRTTLAR